MEFLILLFMLVSCSLQLVIKTQSRQIYLIILSANIIASFVVLMFLASTSLAIVFFVANLMVSPWVAFSKLKDGVPLKYEKDPSRKSLREYLSGR